MNYLGDFAANATVRGSFNTRAKATGAPITLAGSPTLAVYKDNNTSETTVGVTLTVDFDGRAGHHLFSIITSDSFYATGSDFRIVLLTGTVDGESVEGVEVASFSIQNRHMRGTDNANTVAPPTAEANAGAVRTELATELGRIDVAVSTRATDTMLATVAGYLDTEIAAIKAKTDQLTFSTPGKVDSSGTTPAEVWSYFVAATGDDALEKITEGVQDSVNVVVPLNALPFKVQRNASSKLSLRRFVNFTHTINDVGSLNGANRLVFTIKESKDTEADDKSFVQVSATIPANNQTDGVLYANALPAGNNRTGGSVVVEDYTENNVAKKRVVVTIKDYVTALIPVAAEATFDLQYFTASGSFILDEGKISIENATTRSTASA